MAKGPQSVFGIPLSQNRYSNLKKLAQKKYRDREGKVILEGVRACEEALASGVTVVEVLIREDFSGDPALVTRIRQAAIPLYVIDHKKFSSLTQTESPQGLACVVYKVPALKTIGPSHKLVLGLDGIQDPGNLGTIVRTAVWFGVHAVILGQGTADLYNPKVIRSTMGSFFHLSYCEHVVLAEILPVLKTKGYRIIASTREGGETIDNLRASGKDVLLAGNEARGLSPSLFTYVDTTVSIPRFGHGESLNVATATGILLSYLTK